MSVRLERLDSGEEFEVLAFSDQKTVGLVGVGRARAVEGKMILDSLFVTEPGLGIGRQILESLWESARERKLICMTGNLSTFPGEEEDTRGFYEAMGVDVDAGGDLAKDLTVFEKSATV